METASLILLIVYLSLLHIHLKVIQQMFFVSGLYFITVVELPYVFFLWFCIWFTFITNLTVFDTEMGSLHSEEIETKVQHIFILKNKRE